MSARTAGLRIVVVGASGAVGGQVVQALGESTLQIDELLPVGTDRSIGAEVDYRDDILFVASELPPLQLVDLMVLCTPVAASLELIREALRAEVPCIDCSGALLPQDGVPLAIALEGAARATLQPVVMTPSGVSIAWTRVLAEIGSAAGLRRVVGTVVQPVSHAGQAGMEVLSTETIALLSQGETPESSVFPGPVAFDCLPITGGAAGDEAAPGASAFEVRVQSEVARLLGGEPSVSVTALQVPTFVGEGTSLWVETERPLADSDLVALLEKAPGVDLRMSELGAPSTRDTAGADDVLVGRVRRDPANENGLMLWLACDGLRLVAANVAKLVETRFRLN